ncbi:hypothetical protein GCM10009767_00110 [Kocuria aegyptia]|uniref:Uncharacterized protein n=1 Tax=Kocuria aegyptia TaxID=330943 RepID=A0ABN2K261_9MICC
MPLAEAADPYQTDADGDLTGEARRWDGSGLDMHGGLLGRGGNALSNVSTGYSVCQQSHLGVGSAADTPQAPIR